MKGGGGTGFLNSTKSRGTEIFQNQGGKEEFLKFSLGRKLLEMKLQTENKTKFENNLKMFLWVI